jgi:predicted regulator of Ras-like GTPase activity (Roadblock/LC7/MglB family)
MPFQYTLANLLANNEGAIAVLFVDETGETVDLATADFTHFDMKVLGAYVGIYLRQMTDVLEGMGLGTPRLLHIEREGAHLYAVPLPDGYFLALVQRRPALTARARATLERARVEIAREIFGEE